MALFNQITIIGVGLIGGSLAKAIRTNRVAKKIVGFFRNEQKRKWALRTRLVDEGYLSLEESIENSDLIILALPVKHIIQDLSKLHKVVPANTMIIDIGSTKASIVATADKQRLNFLGTHPLAGSEKRGAEHSTETLFDNSLVILTPTKNTLPNTLKKINAFWKQLHAKIVTLTPQQHDAILSRTSHLPHIIAFSLINAIPKECLVYSASGLKDTTRVALSDPALWSDIFITNKKEILAGIASFEQELKKIKNALGKENSALLMRILEAAQQKRTTIK